MTAGGGGAKKLRGKDGGFDIGEVRREMYHARDGGRGETVLHMVCRLT
jgi:hypothetical protein